MSLERGTRLGPYEILGPLGAGGMGEVYRAHDPRLEREVAVKVLPAEFAADPESLRRFEREARAASALNHPNILVVHDIGSEGGQPYLVSELLEGSTLKDILAEEGKLPAQKVIEWGRQIARGLAAAHGKGIVHRDLKPGNLFVTSEDQVKILDFGLAKRRDAPSGDRQVAAAPTADVTSPGTLLGTMGYLSPEQVKGLPAEPRSDLFSLGCVLYEMLAGRRAFAADSEGESLSAILRDDPPPLDRRLPGALSAVVTRCLEKRAGDRFDSAKDVAFALESLSIGEPAPTQLFPLAALRRPLRLRRRTLAAALGLAALAGVGLWRWAVARNPQIHSLAVLPFADQSAQAGEGYLAAGLTEELITQLAQLSALKVISRTSSEALRGSRDPLPVLAQRLGVQVVVQGSIARQGPRVRVSAQLVHGPTDRHLWAGRYEREESNLFGLQHEIARDIAREIAVALTPREERRLATPPPVDREAYREYLQGSYHASRRSADGYLRAIRHFRKAIEIAPDYAAAYQRLGGTYQNMGLVGMLDPNDANRRALEAAQRALELDPELAAAHTNIGNVRAFQWRWKEAEAAFQRARELSGGEDASAWPVLLAQGRIQEAVLLWERELQRDPLSPVTGMIAAYQRYLLRDYRGAIEQCERTLDIAPDMEETLTILADAQAEAGNPGAAAQAYERWARAAGLPGEAIAVLRARFGAEGLPGVWRFLLALEKRDEEETGETWPYRRAAFHARLGESEEAFRWLEAAFVAGTPKLIYLGLDPAFDSLRSDPRFAAYLRRMNLDPAAFPQPSS